MEVWEGGKEERKEGRKKGKKKKQRSERNTVKQARRLLTCSRNTRKAMGMGCKKKEG